MSIKIFSKTVGTLFSDFALSKSPQTQHVVESHPSSICFSSHVFSSRAALFSKTICTQTAGLGCPRTSGPSAPACAAHLEVVSGAASLRQHNACIPSCFPQGWKKPELLQSQRKQKLVRVGAGILSWKRNIGLGLFGPLGFPMGS